MGFLFGDPPKPEPVAVVPEKSPAEKALEVEADILKRRREQESSGNRSTFRIDSPTGLQVPPP